jgi:hypothetical protein
VDSGTTLSGRSPRSTRLGWRPSGVERPAIDGSLLAKSTFPDGLVLSTLPKRDRREIPPGTAAEERPLVAAGQRNRGRLG